MITTVTLGALTLKCDYGNTPQKARIVKIEIPGRVGDVHQVMGKNSKAVELRGILNGSTMDADKATLEGYEGTTQTYTDGTNDFTMLVSFVDVPTIGGQPNHYDFTVRGYEYIQ